MNEDIKLTEQTHQLAREMFKEVIESQDKISKNRKLGYFVGEKREYTTIGEECHNSDHDFSASSSKNDELNQQELLCQKCDYRNTKHFLRGRVNE